MLYQLRYRDKFQTRTGFIEARDKGRAAELGKGWCEGKGLKYLGMDEAVLVREVEEEKRGDQVVRKAG